MKVRIVADGSPTGTRVLDENDRDLSRDISAVRFSHNAGEPPRAEVDIIFATGAALADAQIFHAAPGQERKAIRRIEYVNGTVFDLSEPPSVE